MFLFFRTKELKTPEFGQTQQDFEERNAEKYEQLQCKSPSAGPVCYYPSFLHRHGLAEISKRTR